MTDSILASLSPHFTTKLSDNAHLSIPREQVLRAMLLQGFYTIRSERILVEEIDYSILFRWFIGLDIDAPLWSPATFSSDRDRLLQSGVAVAFFEAVLAQSRTAGLLSDEHFRVDGTVLEGWGSRHRLRQVDGSPPQSRDDRRNQADSFFAEPRSPVGLEPGQGSRGRLPRPSWQKPEQRGSGSALSWSGGGFGMAFPTALVGTRS